MVAVVEKCCLALTLFVFYMLFYVDANTAVGENRLGTISYNFILFYLSRFVA